MHIRALPPIRKGELQISDWLAVFPIVTKWRFDVFAFHSKLVRRGFISLQARVWGCWEC